MKKTWKTRLFAVVLCLTLLASCLPTIAFAESAEYSIDMVEGDVIDFAPDEAVCTSTDPSIAWVDDSGKLNAMKPGTADISVQTDDGKTDFTVTVSDYADGSPIVGNLKILARYNDSMQFYDGHVYLLFTSYQDGVTINVPDLYAGYEIADVYYDDISEDISNGSNHTGSDTDKYFTYSDENTSVTLNRGEIVTIGMYRGFDLSVPMAALGSIQNSTLWSKLVEDGKSAVIENVFRFVDTGKISTDEAIAEIKAVFDEVGLDYNKLLDGVVEGGVCFNRELYNQKLEWDQFENVTYDMDITENQLSTLTAYLGGNYNKFSILKNSCATVALRAWNAAVGTKNGEPNAYYLSYAGEGIFSIIDAPKSVRDSIVARLPGYYLNNSEGVAEPGAGYQDETGWVYVSAPKNVSPLTLAYEDDSIFIDADRTKTSTLINAAKGDSPVVYNTDEQYVDVKINKSDAAGKTTVSSIDFDINGTAINLNADNMLVDGVWFKVIVNDPAAGEDYYVVDGAGKALASEYSDGCISFRADAMPFTYQIMSSSEGAQNLLKTVIKGDAEAETAIYIKNGSDKIALDSMDEVTSGTKVYVKSAPDVYEFDHVMTDITMNGASVYDAAHYDEAEGAYFVIMPEKYSVLTITYDSAELTAKGNIVLQTNVGDTLKATDCAALLIGGDKAESDRITWKTIYNTDNAVEINGGELTAVREGEAFVWACAEANDNIGVAFCIRVYENLDELVAVTYSDEIADNLEMTYSFNGEDENIVPYSGYLVKKGTVLNITPCPNDGQVVSSLTANGKTVKPGESMIVDKATEIAVEFSDAQIKGMPEKIELDSNGDTYQLDAKVKYSGLIQQLLPVYDSSISYVSSDELITVDENGLVTVEGDVPEDGAAVYVTAYAGSSNNKISASTKVIVGDYKGDDIVGSLTIHARRIDKGELIAHGAVTFTTYEDVDIDTSYYHYYKPDDRYNALMVAYENDPESFSSDPALYEMNDLGLEDRESYFELSSHGAMSDPAPVSLAAGESITVSNYGYDSLNIIAIRRALENSTLAANSADTQELIRQMTMYTDGGEYDASVTFDTLLSTLVQIYTISKETGYNPADGHSEGGMDINREMFNQFRRNDSQLPNNYYTVEITADEMAQLKKYMSDRNSNYYSFMSKNCATGAVDIWNTVLSDKPELHLTANLTGVAVDPQSLYFDIGALTLKDKVYNYDGSGGTDFYPRTVRYSDAVNDTIDKIKAVKYAESDADLSAKITEAREAYDALNASEKLRVWNISALTDAESAAGIIGDADGNGAVEIIDATCVQRCIAKIKNAFSSLDITRRGDVDGSGELEIIDATLIQYYVCEVRMDIRFVR